MSTLATLLDQLLFKSAPVDSRIGKLVGAIPSTAISIPTNNARRPFHQAVPFFSRNPSITEQHPSWAAYCGLLRDHGIPLTAHTKSLESLSVANVPVRFARRLADEPLDALELETAEAIEISFRRSQPPPESDLGMEFWGQVASPPIELHHSDELTDLVEVVRELTDGATPIGIGISGGNIDADFAFALAANVDFVVVEVPQSDLAASIYLDEVARAVVKCAKRVQQAPRRPALFIDAAITSPSHFAKLIALGASAVSIDHYLKGSIPLAPSTPTLSSLSMLSGIGSAPARSVPSLSATENLLKELVRCIKLNSVQCGVKRAAELNRSNLRAATQQAAELLVP